ncbi:hypothetical protein [Sphingomonas sp.]|jgi:hypothetical protein|uniref:hypothetical protein n=1 Tax=Sphingomonas sp. TaxID=28214 RepID=UPI00260D7159|nr:hypothetical protein [Sphingomonas sp.]MDF2493634.1 hypothetical protein [Sphingomonas sp.]
MKTLILALSLLLPAAAAPVVDPAAGFCARMAAQHAMKPVSQPSGKPAFEARALKGLGVALFGGSTMVGMQLSSPDDPALIGDPARFADACKLSAGRVGCRISGPAVFEMTVGDHAASTDAAPGEQAEVSMAKNRIRCEER